MSRIISRIWEPVRRKGAERYIKITLVSFAASVSLTRLTLELTGYPQLGNESLHIAHVLFGGIILFIASLLPLIYANRWAYTWGAMLSGIGVGLFIDEVGKFITQNNDYFYPLAAPIIYASFLVTTLLYLRISKDPELDARGELYMVLETLEDVLDHDLEEDEYEELKNRLQKISNITSQQDMKKLSKELLDFLNSGVLNMSPERSNFYDKTIIFFTKIENKWLGYNKTKFSLILAIVLLGIPSFLRLINFIEVMGDIEQSNVLLFGIIDELPTSSRFNLFWAKIHVFLDGFVGLILSISGVLMLLGKERWGVNLGTFGLLVALVGVNLVLFYLDQFSTIITALIQFCVLQALYYFEHRYLKKMAVRV
jgi:hypothetical protein